MRLKAVSCNKPNLKQRSRQYSSKKKFKGIILLSSSPESRRIFLRSTLRRNHSLAMKTAVHASSIFCGALAVLLILCSTPPLSKAQKNKVRPPTPHFYDEYPIRRASIKKVLDGTYAALSFLGEASTQQVRHRSEKQNAIIL